MWIRMCTGLIPNVLKKGPLAAIGKTKKSISFSPKKIKWQHFIEGYVSLKRTYLKSDKVTFLAKSSDRYAPQIQQVGFRLYFAPVL